MVVSKAGDVRFANPAAAPLIVRRAADRGARAIGAARGPARRVAERRACASASASTRSAPRELPAEDAVLLVVRDRTEELRRELAEREFVSNAAHELRNPIAGISGSIEVLLAGAKDDPEAREHFLAGSPRTPSGSAA